MRQMFLAFHHNVSLLREVQGFCHQNVKLSLRQILNSFIMPLVLFSEYSNDIGKIL